MKPVTAQQSKTLGTKEIRIPDEEQSRIVDTFDSKGDRQNQTIRSLQNTASIDKIIQSE